MITQDFLISSSVAKGQPPGANVNEVESLQLYNNHSVAFLSHYTNFLWRLDSSK